MKLELKKFAPYLPYGIKMKYDIDGGSVWQLDISNINAITEYDKLILRPLSDLTKDITNGNDIINFQQLFNQYDFEWLITSKNKMKLINSMDYFIVNKLFEWHFDVFNLRENDLCIYYNEL